MSDDKYIGLDVHQSSIVTAVHNDRSKCMMQSIIETKGQIIGGFIESNGGSGIGYIYSFNSEMGVYAAES